MGCDAAHLPGAVCTCRSTQTGPGDRGRVSQRTCWGSWWSQTRGSHVVPQPCTRVAPCRRGHRLLDRSKVALPPSCTCQASSSPPFQADAQVCGSPPRSDSLHRYLLTTGCTCLIGCSLVHPHKNPEQRGSPASHFTDEAASAPGGAATRPTSQDRARSPGLSESNGVRAVSSCGYGCPTRGLLTLERRRARRPRPAPRKSEFSHARIPATQEPRSPPAWAQTDGALQGCCTRARQPLCPLEGQPLPRRQGGRALGSHSDRGRQPDHGVASQWACHQAAGQDIAVILP